MIGREGCNPLTIGNISSHDMSFTPTSMITTEKCSFWRFRMASDARSVACTTNFSFRKMLQSFSDIFTSGSTIRILFSRSIVNRHLQELYQSLPEKLLSLLPKEKIFIIKLLGEIRRAGEEIIARKTRPDCWGIYPQNKKEGLKNCHYERPN